MQRTPFQFDVPNARAYEYFADMVECFEAYFGKTHEDAVRIVNAMWKGRVIRERDILFQEPPYYWAYYHEHRPDPTSRASRERPSHWLEGPEWRRYLERYYIKSKGAGRG